MLSPSSNSIAKGAGGSVDTSTAPTLTLLPPPAEFSDPPASNSLELATCSDEHTKEEAELGLIDERDYLDQIKQLQVLDASLDKLQR